ncbi:MAG: hypothetical protein AUJ74_00975 [Candidatus Omnitrophica bacterium CG1_02_44_16]|nr:MAG: hypothetical protein AUJ74_00975 [Candidatus Omnitrophica bacterium CG1_02_44_16]PIY82675.1 MAG: hypothetical protein COY78_05230 [Candidatus Omnitrophica bacterium CG_4_10_14_0_8_um_filter_44_12]PIZ84835.1 MAG: hypothetical protein COX96_01500 [Candidatus Omnitrophica bacterium CG_4_10_14_0_2_um_filter_44_9]
MGVAYHKAINVTTGEIIADNVRIAQDFMSRSIGLLNRQNLNENEALLIKPCPSIHTFFMKFPIDVLFLSKEGNIVKIAHSLKPWRLSGCLLGCFMVLELPPGKVLKTTIKLGNVIEIC